MSRREDAATRKWRAYFSACGIKSGGKRSRLGDCGCGFVWNASLSLATAVGLTEPNRTLTALRSSSARGKRESLATPWASVRQRGRSGEEFGADYGARAPSPTCGRRACPPRRRPLLLLRHICREGVCARRLCPQQGHRGSLLTSATARRLRRVAMELGMCRSGRIGGASGSVTVG